MTIPKKVELRKLKKILKPYGIIWRQKKGKGSHGSFVGKDKKGDLQACTLPDNQQREVRQKYIKSILDRFGYNQTEIFD